MYLSRNGTLKSKHRQSLYSVEFGPPVDTIRSRSRDDITRADNLSPKPMTPRRIKRRSMARGSTSRTSTQSRRSHRSSTRNSRRKVHQNPVTKLLEQQNSKTFVNFQNRPSSSDLTVSNLKSLNNDYITAPGPSSTRSASDFRHSPDPIYYNTQQQWDSASPQPPPVYSQGHSNPTYQHSTPNLSHSPEPPEEPYSNRPPSVRSSYSNFHGSRPLSSYNPTTGAKENVFLGLNQPPPTHPKPYAHVQPQTQTQSQPPAPQLPAKNVTRQIAASRESMNSLAFLNSGPPAYNLNYHTPPDSETTM